MRAKNTRKRKALVFAVLVFLSGAAITITSSNGGRVEAGYSGFISVFSYPQRAVSRSRRAVKDFFRGIFSARHLVAENRELGLGIKILEEKISELENYRRENEELRRLLELRRKTDIGTVLGSSFGAEVIGRNPLNWYRTVTVDKGARDGVAENMTAVSEGGLVGRVDRTGAHASSIMLILDHDSRVSALAERTGEHGIIKGRGDGTLDMKYLSAQTDVREGDIIRTSGLGGIFPRGLLIGSVSLVEVSGHELAVSAEVVPSVDFSRLETILILKNP